MRRRLLVAFVAIAAAATGCSLLVSYDGYGDGVRNDGGTASDGPLSDVNATDGSGGADADTDASDAATDALDGGLDANKQYAIVVLGGRFYPDGGTPTQVLADVEYAMINADGTLGAWKPGTPMPKGEDDIGSASWNSSIFISDDFGSAAAVMLPDGGMSAWSTVAAAGHGNPRMVAVDGTLYLATGNSTANGSLLPEVLRAPITGPQTIGAWTQTTQLPPDGGAREDGRLIANGRSLYILGGTIDSSDTTSVLQGTLDDAGAVTSWTPTTPLPGAGSVVRAVVVQNHVTILGASFETLDNQAVYTSDIQGNGSLGAWQAGILHPDRDRCPVVVHNNVAYLLGGNTATNVDTATVIYATIAASGFPGTWQTTTSMLKPKHSASAVVVEVPTQ